jgi:hypothetical protein
MIISPPFQVALWPLLAEGAQLTAIGRHVFVSGLYSAPELT